MKHTIFSFSFHRLAHTHTARPTVSPVCQVVCAYQKEQIYLRMCFAVSKFLIICLLWRCACVRACGTKENLWMEIVLHKQQFNRLYCENKSKSQIFSNQMSCTLIQISFQIIVIFVHMATKISFRIESIFFRHSLFHTHKRINHFNRNGNEKFNNNAYCCQFHYKFCH